MDAIVFERIAYGKSIAAVSAIFVFKLILLESEAVSLANLLLNINEVSAILTFKFILFESAIVSLANLLLNMVAVSAIFTFKASSVSALAFSALIDATVFERIAYGNNIAAVSAIFVFKLILFESATVSLANLRLNINAVSAIFTFKFILLESAAVSLANLLLNINDVSAIFTFNASAVNALLFSASIEAIVLDLIAYGNNIAPVSAILTFSIS